MDETPIEQITYLICVLMEFYHGGVTYKELNNMPLPEVYELYKNAIKIQDQRNREMKT